MNTIRDRKKISISKKYHERYLKLKYNSESTYMDSPFTTLKEIYVLSAIIGAINNMPEPLMKDKESIFESNVFSEHFDIPLLYTIAFINDQNVELLTDDSHVLSVVESYANGGFPLLLAELESNPTSVLMNYATYIQEFLSSKGN